MNKVDKHIELGLSQEELSSAVKSTGNDRLINKFDAKLENCELSRSAIELINPEDIETVLRISNGINNKYLSRHFSKVLRNSIIFVITVVSISGSIFIFSDSGEPEIVLEKSESINNNENRNVLVENTDELLSEPIEKNSVKISNKINFKQAPDINVQDSILFTSDSILNDSIKIVHLSEINSIDDIKKEKVEQTTKDPINDYKASPRIVRGVLVTGMIDPKYKGDNYKISSLVDFKGGNENLQKEIYNRLKSKIKDDDIPSASSTIVFNFEVTSRGKVKKVSVQSRTTPELENIIIKTIEGLDSWKKGSKRASKNYSVFVTFK